MSADNKTGLAPGDASEIEDVTRTAGHDAEGEMANSGDAWKEPDIGSVNIEKVAQLAKLCATGRSGRPLEPSRRPPVIGGEQAAGSLIVSARG